MELVGQWAAACGISAEHARELAAEVLLNQVDWSAQVRDLLTENSPRDLWVVDLGPGTTLTKLFANNAQGTGVGIVEAAGAQSRAALAEPGAAPARTQDWSRFAPRVVRTAHGDEVSTGVGIVEAAGAQSRAALAEPGAAPARTQDWSRFAPRVVRTAHGDEVSTAFTRLTGKPPVLLAGMTPTTVEPEIVAAAANAGYWAELAGGGQKPPVLLAGMTPTTVEPEIVAAAANAGYWAELAGGGQVTAEVFDRNIAKLEEQLVPRRTPATGRSSRAAAR